MEEKVIIEGKPFLNRKLSYNCWLVSLILFSVSFLLYCNSTVFSKFGDLLFNVIVITFCACIIFLVVYLLFGCFSICVTNKRVYGTSVYGRRVDLPLDSISAIGRVWFSGISISTSSGFIKFGSMKNYDELYKVIGDLLIERQDNKDKKDTKVVQEKEDVTEEIRKYKALLDDEIITKKEFEEKKKELLILK